MTFKKYQWSLLFRIALLFGALFGATWLIQRNQYSFLLLDGIFIVAILIDLFRFTNKSNEELEQFVESVHYRDFSRRFDEKNAPVALQPMRKGFNEINSTFKTISKEKETQYVYLQKILELVDTGIISFENTTGNIMWMNETSKQILGVPYLKTIQALERRDAVLFNDLSVIKPGENRVVTVKTDKSNLKILLSATAFQTDGKFYKLVALQNINEALDETEAKAWQKLLNVMTHEIMNSVAPISSLADTLKSRLQLSMKDLDNSSGSVDDLELGIATIKRRSEGLLKFAETYRNLNKITTLSLQSIHVRDIFENLHHLMQPSFQQKNIDLEIVLKDPDLSLEADINLVEQVLINLIVNAVDAVKDIAEPRIVLSGYITPSNRVVIKVSDNGVGMPADIMEKIFIPFFSTRKTGSGIGLSLCKQIMMLHRGNIQVQSIEGEGTAFSLQF